MTGRRPAGLTRRALLAGGAALGVARPAEAAPPPLSLRRGLNLWPWFSLTREFPPPRTDYGWPPFQPGRPVPTAGDLSRLAGSGFDFVRLPVDPGPFLAFTGARRDLLLAQLDDAVASVRDAGLSLVLNVQANGATHHFTPGNLYDGTSSPLFPRYRDLVAEFARRLDRHGPDGLALEPVNEPPQACGAARWTEVQGELMTAARGAAPRLTLVATGACGGLIDGLVALDPAALRAAGPTLFTFHFYEPYLFTHQGAPWMREPVYRALNGVPWPSSAGTLEGTLAAVRARMAADTAAPSADRDAVYRVTEAKLREYFEARPDRGFVDHALSAVRAWADRCGIPPAHVVMGEFGALGSGDGMVAAAADDRARYIEDVRRSAEGFGLPWAMWTAFGPMGLIDPASRAFDRPIARALGLSRPG